MTTTNEKLRNVAEIAAKIMMGEKALHPNQQKLDVHEPEKDELTADDFKKLRAGKKAPEVKKEEVAKPDFLDLDKDGDKKEPMQKASSQMKKEEAEQVDEAEIVKTATGMRVYGSSYGDSAKARRDQVKKSIDTAKGPKMKDLSDIETEKTIKKDSKSYIKDTGQKRAYKVHAGRYFSNLDVGLPSKGREEPRYKNESFANILASYNENGLKGLFEALKKNEVIVEEPDNETFTKEVEAQKAKNAGEGKKAEVSKAAVQAVQNEEYDVLDYNEVNGVRISEIDLEERQMTEPEMKKKEEIVKSMKKGIAGFKERYGDRAKNVMYATATKQAMKD